MTDKKLKEIWVLISVALVSTVFGAIIGGIPDYFDKPSRQEVSSMIMKEAPLALRADIKNIELSQKEIQIRQAEMRAILAQVLLIVEGRDASSHFKKNYK